MTIGNAPLIYSTSEPLTDVEIDQHSDAGRIWATIQSVRKTHECDVEQSVSDQISEIANSLNCSVDEDGLIEFDCEESDEILKALEEFSNFINAFKIGKSTN